MRNNPVKDRMDDAIDRNPELILNYLENDLDEIARNAVLLDIWGRTSDQGDSAFDRNAGLFSWAREQFYAEHKRAYAREYREELDAIEEDARRDRMLEETSPF